MIVLAEIMWVSHTVALGRRSMRKSKMMRLSKSKVINYVHMYSNNIHHPKNYFPEIHTKKKKGRTAIERGRNW